MQLEETVRDLVRKVDGNQATPTSSNVGDQGIVKPGFIQHDSGRTRYLSSFHWNRLTSKNELDSTFVPNVHVSYERLIRLYAPLRSVEGLELSNLWKARISSPFYGPSVSYNLKVIAS